MYCIFQKLIQIPLFSRREIRLKISKVSDRLKTLDSKKQKILAMARQLLLALWSPQARERGWTRLTLNEQLGIFLSLSSFTGLAGWGLWELEHSPAIQREEDHSLTVSCVSNQTRRYVSRTLSYILSLPPPHPYPAFYRCWDWFIDFYMWQAACSHYVWLIFLNY